MTSPARVLRVLHPCLEPLPGAVPLAEARIIDRQRLGVLLQAAGLLSLLDIAGRRLAGWAAARVDAEGRLTVVAAELEAGRARPAQEDLCALLDLLFGGADGGRITGKGDARRAARTLGESWRQSLVAVSPDDAVGQILDAAPFLWEPSSAIARPALGGELRITAEEGGERAVLWAAGPAAFRRRLLAGCADLVALAGRLAGTAAQALWERPEAGDPGDDRIALARSLAFSGRFEAALAALAGLSAGAALPLRAECQRLLGQVGPARATLERARKAELSPEETVDAAETAIRVFANLDLMPRARLWVRRALGIAAPGSRTELRAWLVAALAAWDRQDWKAMVAALEAARPALVEPDLAWRWHHALALLALGRDADGAAGSGHAALALRLGRRTLPRHGAGGLWNDLGMARAAAGDLAGAERAFRHVYRLLAGCDGPRGTTLALSNLAEIRLRRGRPAGVREILTRVTAENRQTGNLRALTQDMELQARCELVEGRPEAALAICRAALAQTERAGLRWRLAELHLLAARALGWLGRSDEAAAALAAAPPPLGELEPEERPAVLALAGRRDEARLEAADLADPGLRTLWAALLDGRLPPVEAWDALSALEPYRAARLVLDAERVTPGSAPAEALRAAAATLRKVGASAFAAALEVRDLGPWRALTAWCAAPPGDPGALAALLAGAGYPEAAVERTGEAGTLVLVQGPGGEAELSVALPGGRLTARARRADPPLAALLALAARDLSGRGKLENPSDRSDPTDRSDRLERPVLRGGGLIGESAVLHAALDRIDRLAAGDVPVLILGESGTGKELAARRVHRGSPRSRAPFIAVNCAALSETLILSDLFGHTRGAFTGADQNRDGVFQTADRGTVFLDEIGDLPLTAQALLLRVIQEGEVRRLGDSVPRKVDVRIIAATHRDLAAMVAAKTFRQDLYYRLKVGFAELPPLRDRGADVLLLADHFLLARPGPERAARVSRTARLSPEARERLLAYPWPGNVRELENVLRAATALAGGAAITPEHLALPDGEKAAATFYHREVDELRRRRVAATLDECGGNRTLAAQRLGMSRQGLSYLLRRFGIG
jgi:two-component system NtrC family response regulator